MIHIYGLAGGNDSQIKLFEYYGMKKSNIFFLPMVIDVNKFKFKPMRKEVTYLLFIHW